MYANVCSTCHGLERVAFRNLVGVAYSEDELKEIAAEYTYAGELDKDAQPTERDGKLTDKFPSPYQNETEARLANNGSLPPDLSLIVKARHGGADYLFSLLTGYREPPAGFEVDEPQHYNPYFPGGKIGMRPPLEDGQVEYDDGTPATVSQMTKDVAIFLSWAAEPEMEERKQMGLKAFALLTFGAVVTGVLKRMRWTQLKNRTIEFA